MYNYVSIGVCLKNTIEFAVENKNALLKMISNILKNVEQAEDSYQNSVIRLLKHDKPVDNIRSFVFTTMHNQSVRDIRVNRIMKGSAVQKVLEFETAHFETPENILLQQDCKDDLRSILDDDILSVKRKRVMDIVMNNDEGVPYYQLAADNNIDPETFRTHIKLSRKELKKYVDFKHFYFPEHKFVDVSEDDDE